MCQQRRYVGHEGSRSRAAIVLVEVLLGFPSFIKYKAAVAADDAVKLKFHIARLLTNQRYELLKMRNKFLPTFPPGFEGDNERGQRR